MSESIQKVLTRRRPPRVKITYDVETGGALEKKELPFIVGIFSDLSGQNPALEKPPLKERKMVEIDGENFDSVMASCGPGIKFKYQMLDGSGNIGDEKTGQLAFNKLEHFSPLQVIKRFPALYTIFVERGHIRDVQARVESNDAMEELFFRIMSCDGFGQGYRDALIAAFDPEKREEWELPGIEFQHAGEGEKSQALVETDQHTVARSLVKSAWETSTRGWAWSPRTSCAASSAKP